MHFPPFPLWFVHQVKGLIQGRGRAKPGILPSRRKPRYCQINPNIRRRRSGTLGLNIYQAVSTEHIASTQGQKVRITATISKPRNRRRPRRSRTGGKCRPRLHTRYRTQGITRCRPWGHKRRPTPTRRTAARPTLQTGLQPTIEVIPKHPENHQQHQVTQIRAKADHGKNH